MIRLLTPRYYALRNRLTRLAPGDGLKTVMLGLLGLGFWAFLFAISFKVLSYFRTIEGLGDLLALRLLSMILLTFFSILVFSNIVTSLSTYLSIGRARHPALRPGKDRGHLSGEIHRDHHRFILDDAHLRPAGLHRLRQRYSRPRSGTIWA